MHSKPALSASPEPTRRRRERAATPQRAGHHHVVPLRRGPCCHVHTMRSGCVTSPHSRAQRRERQANPGPRHHHDGANSRRNPVTHAPSGGPVTTPQRGLFVTLHTRQPIGRRRSGGAAEHAGARSERGNGAGCTARGVRAARPGPRRLGGTRSAGPQAALGRRPTGGATMARDARTPMPAGTAAAAVRAPRDRVRRTGDRSPPGA